MKNLKIIPIAIAIALILAMIWVFFITPPCDGNYKLKIGGSEYFLFECEKSKRKSGEQEGNKKPEEFDFKVLSIDHNSGKEGQYFNFNVEQLDEYLESQTWKEKELQVQNLRTKQLLHVVVWRAEFGGTLGDGHGRLKMNSKPGQWKSGDKIKIIGIK